ncbi:MAG: hypothetical protein ACKVQK_28440, partial [Burkholderiales bacterium]
GDFNDQRIDKCDELGRTKFNHSSVLTQPARAIRYCAVLTMFCARVTAFYIRLPKRQASFISLQDTI